MRTTIWKVKVYGCGDSHWSLTKNDEPFANGYVDEEGKTVIESSRGVDEDLIYRLVDEAINF